ncbi:hypothetical protein MYAM1_000764 [Malassezia yamatoensis]|uniref:BZIP domain-containing protein n=1 Tax=Malassezia yamatoensis TaxID=253288 RepID=A0AAJ5YQU3_9BASI|nr:hypothetical protein MYAM1_000764 [Malassezia yamatoensis]
MATMQSSAIDPSILVRSASVGIPTNPSVCVGTKRRADQAELSDSTCSSSCSSSLDREEEKKARLVARQQRNRQSAQISREKKKAHIEQLEQEVQLLRDEKQSWYKREAEEARQREQLEERVVDLDSKVHTLETLLIQFVQQQQEQQEGMPNTTGQQITLPQSISSSVLPTNLHSRETACSSAGAASAAPIAASSSTVAQPFLSASSNSTCLPAAKATSTQQDPTGATIFDESEQNGPSTESDSAITASNGSSIAGWLEHMFTTGTEVDSNGSTEPFATAQSDVCRSAAAGIPDSITDSNRPAFYGSENALEPITHTVNTDVDLDLLLSSLTPGDATTTPDMLSCDATPSSHHTFDTIEDPSRIFSSYDPPNTELLTDAVSVPLNPSLFCVSDPSIFV